METLSSFHISNEDTRLAQQIAQEFIKLNVDANELHKALQFLVAHQSGPQFFAFLETLQRKGNVVVRSNRTLEYYGAIRQVCWRHLRPYQQDVPRMAHILGWAVRLIPFYRLAPHLPQPQAQLVARAKPAAVKAPPSEANRTGQQPTTLSELQPGMELQGRIKRFEKFGAFVDIGIGQDGLAHVSKMREGFVQKPEDVAQIGETVTVWVETIDVPRGRISLTMIEPQSAQEKPQWIEQAKIVVQERLLVTETEATEPASIHLPNQKKALQAVSPPRPVAIRISTQEQAISGTLVKGTVRKIEQNRMLINIGLSEDAVLTFDRLPGQLTDPDEVAKNFPAGIELDVRISHTNKRGKIQLTL